MALQRAAGNRSVSRLLAAREAGAVRRKGPPNASTPEPAQSTALPAPASGIPWRGTAVPKEQAAQRILLEQMASQKGQVEKNTID